MLQKVGKQKAKRSSGKKATQWLNLWLNQSVTGIEGNTKICFFHYEEGNRSSEIWRRKSQTKSQTKGQIGHPALRSRRKQNRNQRKEQGNWKDHPYSYRTFYELISVSKEQKNKRAFSFSSQTSFFVASSSNRLKSISKSSGFYFKKNLKKKVIAN